MKQPIKCYVPVSVLERTPADDDYYNVIMHNNFRDVRSDYAPFDTGTTHWLDQQELITFTKEEWIEQEKVVELFQQTIDNQTNIIIEKDDEITRLKGLIETQIKINNSSVYGQFNQRGEIELQERAWQQFKTENNL